jgi:hypothetical protein
MVAMVVVRVVADMGMLAIMCAPWALETLVVLVTLVLVTLVVVVVVLVLMLVSVLKTTIFTRMSPKTHSLRSLVGS